jgi:UDPglucose 6-dehydrogenase
VGTPPDEDGSADLRYVLGVADHLGKIMTGYKVIVDKSTVPVGTADKVHAAIAANFKGEFDVVSNPEFLREGVAVDDFMKPDRVVIGAANQRAFDVMDELYAPYVRQGNPVMHMDCKSAELTKYAANSFLATKVVFMNQIKEVCNLLGADFDNVINGVKFDDRIGTSHFDVPGPDGKYGFGGACFPKDTNALFYMSAALGKPLTLLDKAIEINNKIRN